MKIIHIESTFMKRWGPLSLLFPFRQNTKNTKVYGSYLEDGVFPPLQLWESALTPLETVDATVNLTTGRIFVPWFV